MKPLTQAELESLVPELQGLVGSRFQEFETTDQQVGLGFYSRGQLVWWIFDLSPACPLVARMERWPLKARSKVTPVLLFGRAHFVNRILNSVTVASEFGRVLRLDFGGRTLEIRLFPHGTNLLFKTEDKGISLHKADPLEPVSAEASVPQKTAPQKIAIRSLEQLTEAWQGRRSPRPSSGFDPERALQKKSQALQELQRQLEDPQWIRWQELGQWIQNHQSLDVPVEQADLLRSLLAEQPRPQISELISQIFTKAKSLKQKLEGTQARMEVLKSEVEALQRGEFPKPPVAKKPTLANARLRTVQIGDFELRIGRTAQDNLEILRKSQAWDYWLHLKDYPGCHGILSRRRNQDVPAETLREAGCWIAFESKKAKLIEGDKFDLLVAETRYVRPIKGDKIGRVNYSSERVLTVTYSNPKTN